MRIQAVIEAKIDVLKCCSKNIVFIGCIARRADCIKHKQLPWSLADLQSGRVSIWIVAFPFAPSLASAFVLS